MGKQCTVVWDTVKNPYVSQICSIPDPVDYSLVSILRLTRSLALCLYLYQLAADYNSVM